jgi:hypothetical protein
MNVMPGSKFAQHDSGHGIDGLNGNPQKRKAETNMAGDEKDIVFGQQCKTELTDIIARLTEFRDSISDDGFMQETDLSVIYIAVDDLHAVGRQIIESA